MPLKTSFRIAILASDNMLPDSIDPRSDVFERDEQMSKLVPAFAASNMQLELIRWKEAANKAVQFDALLPLFVWDYFEGNEKEFLNQIQQAATRTVILNSPELIAWNSDKSYLADLQAQGAAVIPTHSVPAVSESTVRHAFQMFNCDQLVIKPQVGGGAWRQVLLHKDDKYPPPNTLPPAAALVQPFLPSVTAEGEYSLVFFGGDFSHALIKRPKSGDYRIQSIYGGTEETYQPTTSEQQQAKKLLQLLPQPPLYARIDFLRGLDQQLKLIEMELIEPYLYLPHAIGDDGDNQGAQRLAQSLQKYLIQLKLQA